MVIYLFQLLHSPLILTTISVADLREASLLVLLLLPPMYDGRGLFIPRD